MKRTQLVIASIAVSGLALAAWQVTARAADAPYKQSKVIQIGGEGGWDYLSVDSGARRLYVSHATKVVVIDLDKETVVGEVAPTPGVHGLAVAPDLGQGFVSDGQESKAAIVDLKTLQIASKVDTGREPGLHPVRAAAQGGLHLQRPRQVGDGLRRDHRNGQGDDPAAWQAGVRRRGRQGGAHLQQHRGHEPGSRHRHRHATRWSRRGRLPRARRHRAWRSTRQPSPVHRLQQQHDGDDGQHQREDPVDAAHRGGRGCKRLRPGHGPRLRIEQRRHADGGEGGRSASWRSCRSSPRRRDRGR